VLGRYYVENRIPVGFDQLSPYLVKALVATEDERYYGHSGIDFEALSRVIVRTGLMGQRSAGGGPRKRSWRCISISLVLPMVLTESKPLPKFILEQVKILYA